VDTGTALLAVSRRIPRLVGGVHRREVHPGGHESPEVRQLLSWYGKVAPMAGGIAGGGRHHPGRVPADEQPSVGEHRGVPDVDDPDAGGPTLRHHEVGSGCEDGKPESLALRQLRREEHLPCPVVDDGPFGGKMTIA
jgi:hypothetical protein